MSAAATLAPAPTSSTTSALAGVGTLTWFLLRRDRIRIPVWVTALTVLTVATATSFRDLYPTAADRQVTAETMRSPAGLAMTGPERYLDDYTFGSMLGHQMIGFTVVLVALMSILLIVRHTRAEEESGRAELLRSTVVGRHATMTAALVVAVIANLVLAALLMLVLGGLGIHGVTWGGSVLYGLTHAAVGLVFAGVAAVTAQVTEHTRGASGMALALVGAAYVLRAAGDVSVDALAWLSPIGWVQRTYVYVDDRWWPLLLPALATAALVAAALWLSTRRDLGAGLRAARPGAAGASSALLHPVGFALRLHRGLLIGFSIAMALMGTAYGSILGEAEEMLSGVEGIDAAIADIGGSSMAESWASLIIVIVAVIASVYVVLAALRPASEEAAGRAEPVLATALSRTRWFASHLSVVLVGGTAVLGAAGLAFGVAGALSTGDAALVASLTGACLAYAPAVWVTAGAAAVLVGLRARAGVAAWILPAYAFLVGYLGNILQFPEWMNDLSPFSYVPQLPAAELTWAPLLVLTAIAAGLLALSLVLVRRRDVRSN